MHPNRYWIGPFLSLGICQISVTVFYHMILLYYALSLSRIQTLTSKITQICQDIRDIKLRQLLITRSEEEPIVITNNILTNQNDHKDTLGSDRRRPETPGIHGGCAEDGNDYVYRTPNRHELDNQDNLQRHDTCQPQRLPRPSGMTPEPLPYPDPSEASETPSRFQLPFRCH